MNTRPPENLLDRIINKISIHEDCWWYESVSPDGYARIPIRLGKGKYTPRLAHRVSYIEFVGVIPKGLDLDHTCHNNDKACLGGKTCLHRRCVNPAHLEPVTRQENLRRGKHNNRGRTHCRRGHPFVEGSYYIHGNSRQCKPCMVITGALKHYC